MRACKLALTLLSLGLGGCRTIPLSADPLMPGGEHASPPAYFDVEWWKPLVKGGLLEYLPSETASPAVDPDTERVLVCTRDGFVRALSPIDGKVEWELKVGPRCFAGASIQDGVALIPAGDQLIAVRSRTGEELWRYGSGEELVTVPLVVGELILVASQSDTVFAVDRATGKWKWQYRRDSPPGFTVRGASSPVVVKGQVYVGFADGYLVCLGLSDGVQKWERNLTATGGLQFLDVDSRPIVVDETGRVFAASYKDGIYALHSDSGDLEWTTSRSGVSSLLSSGDVIYASGDGRVTALHSLTGRVLWSLDLTGGKKTGLQLINQGTTGRPPLLLKGLLAVPTAGSLVFVDPAMGKAKLSWNPGKGVTATPTRYGQRLYVLSNLGTLFALKLRGGGG